MKPARQSIVQSAESAIEFGRRLQRREIAELRSLGSFLIPSAPTNLQHFMRKHAQQETVFVVDDIADSPDYKNKHAIVHYLKDSPMSHTLN